MKSIIKSLVVIMAVATVATVATRAYFADRGQVLGSTMSAGSVDLKLANADANWGDNVSGTWNSPAGLKPGDTFEATLYMRNTGNTDIHWVYLDFKDVAPIAGTTLPDAQDFSNQIIVTEMRDSMDNYVSNYAGNFISSGNGIYDRNNDGKLSLWELVNGDAKYPSNNTPSDVRLYNGNPTNGNWKINYPMLPANNVAEVGYRLKFEFPETGTDQSILMSKGFTFTVDAQGTSTEVVNVGSTHTPTE